VLGQKNVAVAVLALCPLLGCRPKSSLGGIARPDLALYLGDTARVMVVAKDAPFSRNDCPLLAPDTRATINDVPLVRLRGIQASDDFAYNRNCLLELSAPRGSIPKSYPTALLRIWDDTTSWLFEVPTAFAQRSLELAYPGQAVSKRGDRIALAWSPPSDDLDPTRIAFELMHADGRPGSGTVIREPEISGASLELVIPAAAGPNDAWSGPALLRFLGTPGVHPALGPCPVDTCSVDLHFEVPSLPITITD